MVATEPMQTATDPSAVSAFAWNLPPWAHMACRALQTLVLWLGITGAMIGCGVFVHRWLEAPSFLGFLLLLPLWFLAVAIHEGGHLLGARSGGMTVMSVQVGNLEFKALRKRWRMRLVRRRPGLAGLVLAFPDPARAMRGPWVRMILGGPLANALAAGVFTIASVALWRFPSVTWLLGAFAILNLALALANLLPTQGAATSDGLALLRWLRCRDEQAPELVFPRLNGMAVKGVTADRLPVDQIAALESQPMPMPLIHTWFVVKRHQNLREWTHAAALQDTLEQRVAEVPEPMRQSMKALVAILRCEIRFSREMAGLPSDAPIDHDLDAEVDWHVPSLRPRCRALMAARAGDSERARQLLDESGEWARSSLDRALEVSESWMREAVLAHGGGEGPRPGVA